MSEISSTSPNYFHDLSDIPISPVLLLGGHDNYTEWSTNIRNLLQAKQMFGYIDGSITKPLTNPDITMWLKTNSMIVGWILKSIDPKLGSTVDSVTNANKLWETLQSRLSLGVKARVYGLKSKIGACKQDGQSVDDYLSRLCEMWNELSSYKSIGSCSCDAAKSIEKEKDEERVYQFLMGLDDVMKTKIDFFIMGKAPLPTLYQAYWLIKKEEEHIQAARSKGLKHVSCSHCGRKGHEVERCFSLHGCPEERQRNKSTNIGGRRGRQASTSGKSTNTQARSNASDQTIQSLKSPDPSQKAVTIKSPVLVDSDKFKAFLTLRAMQDPKSNIYSGSPSASDSNRFAMTQKLETKGGNGGQEWDDGVHEGVSQIYIREGRGGIESIKFDYVKNEQPKAGPVHGGSGHSGFTEWFDLNHTCDEHIVSVMCYLDEGAIQGLVIKTNIRTSAYMGYNVGTTFKIEVKGKKIIGFHGSSDKNLYSLGAYFAPLSPANQKY